MHSLRELGLLSVLGFSLLTCAAADEPAPVDRETQIILDQYDEADESDLAKLLSHKNPTVRKAAASRLENRKEPPLKAIPALIKSVGDSDPEVAQAVMDALANYGEASQGAVAALSRSMDNPDKDVASRAASTLGKLGPVAKDAVPALIAVIKTKDHTAQKYAVAALGLLGPDAKAAIGPLTKLLEDYSCNEEAAESLGRIGAKDVLLAYATNEQGPSRREATRGLGFIRPGTPDVARVLIEALKSDDWSTRSDALEGMKEFRPSTDQIVAAIGSALDDQERTVRSNALDALAGIEPKLASAVPLLLKMSQDKDEWLRDQAVRALGKFEVAPEARLTTLLQLLLRDDHDSHSYVESSVREGKAQFAPILIKLIHDEQTEPRLRAVAVHSLWVLMETDEERSAIKPILRRLLNNPKSSVAERAYAAGLLADIFDERDSPEIVLALAAGLRDGAFFHIKENSAYALGRLRRAESAPPLIEALADPDKRLARVAAVALGIVGREAAAAVPTLIERMRDPECKFRDAAIESVGDIRARTELSIPALLELLAQPVKQEGYDSLRSSVISALGKVGPSDADRAPAVVQALLPLLDDERSRSNVVKALREFGPAAGRATPRLAKLLETDKESGVWETLYTLQRIGPEAEAAVPQIVRWATYKEDHERNAALEALGKIQRRPDLAVPVLVAALTDGKSAYTAVAALEAFGADAAPAVVELRKMLLENDLPQVNIAARTLAAIGPAAKDALPDLRKALERDDIDDYRSVIIEAILKLDPSDTSIVEAVLADIKGDWQVDDVVEKLGSTREKLIGPALASKNPQVRRVAAQYLSVGLDAEQFAPLLEPTLKDIDPGVRTAAAMRLASLGRNSPVIVNALIANLGQGDRNESYVLENAFRGLGRAPALPLAKVVLDSQAAVRARLVALRVLNSETERSRPALPTLRAALSNGDESTRMWAALAVYPHERRPFALEPHLQRALASDDRQLASTAAQLLANWYRVDARLWSPETVDRMIAFLAAERPTTADNNTDDADDNSGYDNLEAIAQWLQRTNLTAPQIAALEKLLASTTRRSVALIALGKNYHPEERNTWADIAYRKAAPSAKPATLLPISKSAREALIAILLESPRDEHDYEQQSLAREAANVIQGRDPQGTETLLKLAENPQAPSIGRAMALETLGQKVPLPESLPARLKKLTQSDDRVVQAWAAIVLCHGAAGSPELLDILAEALVSTNHTLAGRAGEALGKLNVTAKQLAARLGPLVGQGVNNQGWNPTVASVLADRVEASPEVVAALVAPLSKPLEHYAARSLGAMIGRAGDTGIAALAKSVQTSEGAVRLQALDALRGAGTNAKSTVPLLKTLIAGDDEQVRHKAACALAAIDPTAIEGLPTLRAMLKSDHDEVRSEAHNALVALGKHAAPMLPDAISLLDDRERSDHYSICEMIAAIGPDASDATPALIRCLSNRDNVYYAGRALGKIGPAASAAVPALIKYLDDPEMQGAALEALKGIGPAAEPATRALLAKVKDPARRYEALESLGRLGKTAESAVRPLTGGLRRDDPELRRALARALGNLGPVASSATPELLGLVREASPELKTVLLEALGLIHSHPEQVVPVLIAHLADPDVEVREAALRALLIYDAAAAPAMSVVLRLVEQQEIPSEEVLFLMQSIGPPAASGTAWASRQLQSPAAWLRYTACNALGSIGPAAQPARTNLVALHQRATEPQHIRRAAGVAIWKVDPAEAKRLKIPPPKAESETD